MQNSSVILFIALAFVIGAMLPTQVAINSKLAGAVESPVMAAFLSFAVGTVALFSYVVISGIPLASAAQAKNAPPIAWTGGLLGAVYVVSSIVLLPKLGAALTITLIIAGQMLMSLVIDHFGLLGMPVREISLPRVAGAVLVLIGVLLIRKY